MARKKSKKSPVRRRRMGATNKNDMMQYVYLIGGAVAANVLEKSLPDEIAGTDISKYKAAIPAIIGVVIPMMSKSPIAKQVGLGMVAGAGATLLKDAGIIGALGGDEAPMIAAYRQQAYLNATNEAPMISGNRYSG